MLFFAMCGLPVADPDHADQALRQGVRHFATGYVIGNISGHPLLRASMAVCEAELNWTLVKHKMQFAKSVKLAIEIQDLMRPYCERIEIAGSIRRECSEVKDIEIVCIPKWEDRPDNGFHRSQVTFFAELKQPMVKVNLLHEAMMRAPESRIRINWIKPGTSEIVPWHINADGKYWRGLVAGADGNGPIEPIKLDLFLCQPNNWGVIFCIRTGSADFSRALVTYARDRTRYRVVGGQLRRDVERSYAVPMEYCPVPCLEESDLFTLLGLEFRPPIARRDERDVRPL